MFVALGLTARAKPDLNHHLMHACAALASLAIVGSLGSAIGRSAEGWARFAQIATIVLCGAYLAVAVQSFRQARDRLQRRLSNATDVSPLGHRSAALRRR